MTAAGRFPSGEGDAVGVGEVELGLLHVARHVDEHGPAAAGARDVEGGLENLRQLVHVLNEPRVLDDRDRDPGDVAFLERVGADQEGADLTGDADERRRVHPRIGDRRDEVRRTWPRGRDSDANLAGGAGVALCHVPGALLMPCEHVPDGRPARHRVVERQDRAAGDAEDDVDALRFEAAENRICTVHPHAAPAHGWESWKPETTRDVNSRVVAPTPRRSRSGVCGPSTSAADTALARVAPATGACRPCESIIAAASSMLLGFTTPVPASAKPPSAEGTNRLGPCSASRPCAATRAVAGAAAISTIASAHAAATMTT